MSARLFIAIPCLNRKRTVKQCVPTVLESKAPQDSLMLYNDGSTEYSDDFLISLGGIVPRGTNSTVGIEAQRRRHFNDFWEQKDSADGHYTHLYLTDSDALHDPSWRREALRLQSKYEGVPLCLYNTEAHARLVGNTIEDNTTSEVIWRRVAPGISYLLTRDHVAQVMRVLPSLPEHWHWDWTVPSILSNYIAVSRISYVDHVGDGGLHHPFGEGLDGGDRATNPTDWLVKKRKEVVASLSKEVVSV